MASNISIAVWIYLVMCLVSFIYLIFHTNHKVHLKSQPFLPENESPFVSIIVPTYNEESNIVACLKSLKGLNYPNYEVILTDGGSTDRTVEVANGIADKVVVDGTLPDGWIGKSWGCHLAVQKAVSPEAEILLFTDADTRHEPDSLSYAVSHLINKDKDLLSLLPYQHVLKYWESFVPVFYIVSMIVPGGVTHINDPEKKNSISASGQYMLFRRSSYDKIGGHESIKGSVVEDVALGYTVKQKLGGLLWVENDKLVHARMYPDSFKSFWEGFKKATYSGTKFYPPIGIFMAVLISLWGIFGFGFIILAIIDRDELLIVLTIVSVLIFPMNVFLCWRGKGQHYWLMYAFPFVMFFMLIVVMIGSVVDLEFIRTVYWRGRKYTNVDLLAGVRED
jgi:chlorobactene glucosyltransferase